MLVLVKSYDNKKAKSPFSWVILPLTQPQVANQQKKELQGESTHPYPNYPVSQAAPEGHHEKVNG